MVVLSTHRKNEKYIVLISLTRFAEGRGDCSGFNWIEYFLVLYSFYLFCELGLEWMNSLSEVLFVFFQSLFIYSLAIYLVMIRQKILYTTINNWITNRIIFNTFVSQHLVFGGKNWLFLFENALNLTHEKWLFFSSETRRWEGKVLTF